MIAMGRIENGRIVNHSGAARVSLNQQQLAAIVEALDKWIDYLRERRVSNEAGSYLHGLQKSRRRLKKNMKRLQPFLTQTPPLSESQILFVKPKDDY